MQILVQRNEDLYRADFDVLSSIVLFSWQKEEFFRYLDSLSSMAESMNNAVDMELYSKDEAKSMLASLDALSNLNSNGSLVLKETAASKASTLLSKNRIGNEEDKGSWYQTQMGKCGQKIVQGFKDSRGFIIQKIPGASIEKEYMPELNYDEGVLDKWEAKDLETKA